MIISVSGEFYILESDTFPTNEELKDFFQDLGENDILMTLTFMFSYVIHPGTKNPGKKFFVIDGGFQFEGMYGIWHKAFTAARYALAKGYIPAFKIISSTANIYSNYKDDDIWNKFFLQTATKDAEIYTRMGEYYVTYLTCTDQKRYVTKPGQLLMDLHKEKKKGDGFRLGAEYICSVSLLAQCDSLIASGNCGALDEALRENDGRYRHIYKFEL